MRALARDLKVSPAFVSNVLMGKKKIPFRLIEKLARVLDIDDQAVLSLKESYLPPDEALRQASRVKSKINKANKWKLGERANFNVLKQWYYIPILELTSCTGTNDSPVYIGQRLGLSAAVVEDALQDLLAMGLLQKSGKGRVRKTEALLKLASANSREDVRRFHAQMLEKAKTNLTEKTTEEDFKKRLITGITVTASQEKIEVAKKMLSDSLQEIAEFLTEEAGTEIYQIAAQLFPISN